VGVSTVFPYTDKVQFWFLSRMGGDMRASKITAVDFFDDLASPYARKRFFWGFIILSLLCIVGIYLDRSFLPVGGVRDVTDAILIQVLAGLIIVLAFYGFYMHFIGPHEGSREITVTRPGDISDRITGLPLGARHYTFWGRSGSYFRYACAGRPGTQPEAKH
jgi:hypothetical protein